VLCKHENNGVLVFEGFIFLSIVAACLALFISFWATGSYAFLSPSTLFVLLYVTFIHIGAIFVFVDQPQENENFIVVSSIGLFCFAVGQFFSALPRRKSLKQRMTTLKYDSILNDMRGEFLVVWKAFFVTSGGMALIYILLGLSRAGGIPAFDLFGRYGDLYEFKEARQAFCRVPGAGYLFQFYGVILPITTAAFLMRFFSVRKRDAKWIALLLCVYTGFALIAPGHRGPIMIFMITIAVTASYYFGNLNSPFLRRLALMGLIFFAVLTAGKLATSDEDVDLVRATANRIFRVQALGPQYVYATFPKEHAFFYGETLLQDLAGVLPGRQKGFSSLLPELRNKQSFNNPIGSMADIYINFGMPGMIIFMITLGALCQWIHTRLVLHRRTISRIALGSGIVTAVGYSSLAGLVGVFFQFGIVTVGIMAMLMQVLPGAVKRRGYLPVIEERRLVG
jgi:oligosaccharide repeat unit polymerase